MPSSHPSPATVGQLKSSGYTYRPVKDELRANLIKKLRAGETIFPGIVGYRDNVMPQVINGILAKHDMLFLGLRGQAKDADAAAARPTCYSTTWIPIRQPAAR